MAEAFGWEQRYPATRGDVTLTSMGKALAYDESIVLPRAVRFPVELEPPPGFDPSVAESWPEVAGRLEYVAGRLLFMPPCGDAQQDVVADIVITLGQWCRVHQREFVLGTNEAGMHLQGETRAADAAVWRRRDVGAQTGRLRRHPPILAVEVAGSGESEAQLSPKAEWYLGVGVAVVWIVLPSTREVVVMNPDHQQRHQLGESIPEHPDLPGLKPEVEELFLQLE